MSHSPDDIRAELERVLASPGFASADRASRFLKYVVERTLAGEGDQLKEYVIGRAVFDRSDDYDPRIDSIVRVEAGRLRSKVEEYYAVPGRNNVVAIRLRKGSYAPVFETQEVPGAVQPAEGSISSPPSRAGRNLALVVAGAAVVALAAWGSGLWAIDERAVPPETIAVLPFSNYSIDPAEKLLAARITDGITAEIARLGSLGVVSHTSALQFGDVNPRPSLKEIAKTLNAQFVLEGRVEDDGERVTIQVVLVDASLDRKIWVHRASGAAPDIPRLEREIAQAAATAVRQRKR